MHIRNTSSSYGAVAIFLHWLVALAVFGLFALGYWMVDLTYYHEWYKRAPDIHRSIGILLLAVMVIRLVWRGVNVSPSAPAGHKRWEVRSARLAHALLYVLIFVAMVSGYLISTADGSSISVFGWFEVPSVTGSTEKMEEPAGTVHYWATWSIIGLSVIHAAAALKHHFIDRDNTLRRMLGR
jgi:cytochrome b561